MMDNGAPDQKRPRLAGSAHGPWPSSTETSRQLPPVPNSAPPYQHHSPFTRPPEHTNRIEHRPSVHAEPPHYDPDHRRPGSGPAAHSYHNPLPQQPPSYVGAREAASMVKRDPSDEPPQPQYRPASTGTTGDHNVHPGPQPLPQHNEAYARPHSSFEPHGRPQSYAPFQPPPTNPQSPMSATEAYHPQSFTGQRDPYPTVSYPSNGNSNKPRKAQRAAQACDQCRALKAKCDEGRPSCSSCREKNSECRYRDPPPKQQDKVSADILEILARMEGTQNSMRDVILKNSLDIRNIQNTLEAPRQNGVKEESPNTHGGFDVGPSHGPIMATTESPSHHQSPPPGHLAERHDPLAQMAAYAQDEEDEDSGDPGPPKPPSIPINHTTGAARLLLIPQIKEMCKGIVDKSIIKNEKYPMYAEERRGLLRLYGRGEGTDAPLGYDKDPSIDHGSESTPGDTSSDVSSPAEDQWGQAGGLTPPPNIASRGEIGANGMPDFSRKLVLELVECFKENILNMHPLIVPKILDRLVESFLRITDNPAKPKVPVVNAGFVYSQAQDSPGNKRKRSPGVNEHPNSPEVSRDLDFKAGHPFRSISTALVLCVLALGSICRDKEKIRECASDKMPEKEHDGTWSSSPTIRNGHPYSPMQNSPSIPTPIGIPSPQDRDRGSRSRRTSVEGLAYPPKNLSSKAKNLDVIPGLAYFALATDIIGNQLGGNTLQHIHVNILAGLYHGQLARVLESHAYISQACRAVQIILRPKLDRFRKLKAQRCPVPVRDNPLIFAFWTCLQLESDIVAELPMPHSGILTYEDDMPQPNLQAAIDIDQFSQEVIKAYLAQLFMRKHLNMLHNMLYQPGEETSNYTKSTTGQYPTISACEEASAPQEFAGSMIWNEDDGPSPNILAARLRAKYYGAQVITYRPFLLKILELSAGGTPQSGEQQGQQPSSEFKEHIRVPPMHENPGRTDEVNPEVLAYAINCIKALRKSTTAFWGLGNLTSERIMVTNIWGTAHAQWGNVLTLQAAYKDPILKPYVDTDMLRELTIKTIAFLKLYAQPSSALYIDYRILEHTGALLKLIPQVDNRLDPSTSFSSSTTVDTPR